MPIFQFSADGDPERAEVRAGGTLTIHLRRGNAQTQVFLHLDRGALSKEMASAINATIAAHDPYLPDGDDIAAFDLTDDDHEIIPPGFVVSLGYRVTLGRAVPRAPDDATDDAQLVYARLYDEAGQSVPMPEWIRSRLPLDRYEAAAIESVRDGLALRPAAAE